MDEKIYLPNTDIYEQEYENEYETPPSIKERDEHKHGCPILFVASRTQQRLVGLTDISETEYHHLRCSWRAQSDGSCITIK
jgi:hypothetical protein